MIQMVAIRSLFGNKRSRLNFNLDKRLIYWGWSFAINLFRHYVLLWNLSRYFFHLRYVRNIHRCIIVIILMEHLIVVANKFPLTVILGLELSVGVSVDPSVLIDIWHPQVLVCFVLYGDFVDVIFLINFFFARYHRIYFRGTWERYLC